MFKHLVTSIKFRTGFVVVVLFCFYCVKESDSIFELWLHIIFKITLLYSLWHIWTCWFKKETWRSLVGHRWGSSNNASLFPFQYPPPSNHNKILEQKTSILPSLKLFGTNLGACSALSWKLHVQIINLLIFMMHVWHHQPQCLKHLYMRVRSGGSWTCHMATAVMPVFMMILSAHSRPPFHRYVHSFSKLEFGIFFCIWTYIYIWFKLNSQVSLANEKWSL